MTYDQSTIGGQVKEHMRKKYGIWTGTAAANLGISTSYICSVMAGRRDPSKKILDDMGLKKKTIYVPKEKS